MAPRISLCMIVRDEAELLPRFLASARGLWDELVAVDTGSRDATPALLEAAGARVLREPWRDDFAAARNVGLAAATGDLVLVLDADEMAPPALAPALRAAAADPGVGAASLLIRSPLPHGHLYDTRLLRAFRRDPAVRYRHAIHEDVTEDVLALLARRGQRLAHLAPPIEHLGYVRGRAAARGKKERDVRILERSLETDPRDLYLHFKLLEQARFWSDAALAARAAAAAERALREAAGPGDAAPAALSTHFAGELLTLVADGLHRAEPAAALAFLEAWAPRVRPSAALHLRRGELLEELGRPAEAAAAFEACRALSGDTAHVQLATVRPLLGLARLALARGDAAEARTRLEEALALAPRDPEALLGAASLHLGLGGPAGLRAFARARAAAAGGAGPELDAAVGEAALLGGQLDLALGALAQAAGQPPSGRAGLRLAQALLAAGDLAAARVLSGRLAPGQPEAALGVLLCDLAEGRDSDLSLDLTQEEADRALRGWVAAARAGGRAPVLEALRRGAPALAGVFPWLAEELSRPGRP